MLHSFLISDKWNYQCACWTFTVCEVWSPSASWYVPIIDWKKSFCWLIQSFFSGRPLLCVYHRYDSLPHPLTFGYNCGNVFCVCQSVLGPNLYCSCLPAFSVLAHCTRPLPCPFGFVCRLCLTYCVTRPLCWQEELRHFLNLTLHVLSCAFKCWSLVSRCNILFIDLSVCMQSFPHHNIAVLRGASLVMFTCPLFLSGWEHRNASVQQ